MGYERGMAMMSLGETAGFHQLLLNEKFIMYWALQGI